MNALREFLPHQAEAYEWARTKSRIALFMEMRLGKSMVAIRWAKSIVPTPDRILIVAPSAAIPDWQREFSYEQSTLLWIHGNGVHKRMALYNQAVAGGQSFFITGYETLLATPELAQQSWSCVIADESTRIRNPKAKITKLFLNAFTHVPHKACLTGMPNPENWMDFCCQFLFLCGEFCGTKNFWQAQRLLYNQFAYDWYPRKGTQQRIAKFIDEHAFARTRTQCNIGPEKVYESRVVDLNPLQRRLIRAIDDNYQLPSIDSLHDEGYKTKWRVAVQTVHQRIAGGFRPERGGSVFVSDAKLLELHKLLTEDLRHERHVVVWFKFNNEIRVVRAMLSSINKHHTIITGATHPAKRGSLLQEWRDTGGVLLAQVRCARYGVDCSHADTAIYYSTPYDAEYRIQSEDRIIHPLKKHTVLIIDLIARDSIDEDIYAALRNKRYDAESVYLNYVQRRSHV